MAESRKTCPLCKGERKIEAGYDPHYGNVVIKPCPECKAKGWVAGGSGGSFSGTGCGGLIICCVLVYGYLSETSKKPPTPPPKDAYFQTDDALNHLPGANQKRERPKDRDKRPWENREPR